MLTRRRLLVSAFTLAVIPAPPAFAFLPAILAALAAVTALAYATGKAAEGLQAAVDNGARLWMVLKSMPEEEAAANQLADHQRSLRYEMGIGREVVEEAQIQQEANGEVVNSVRLYLFTRKTGEWEKVASALNRAVIALETMASVIREKAAWFPAEAQAPMAELPKFYEARVSIISDLQRLSRDTPPETGEELSAWTKLVEAYDQLRQQSLKLIRALDIYSP